MQCPSIQCHVMAYHDTQGTVQHSILGHRRLGNPLPGSIRIVPRRACRHLLKPCFTNVCFRIAIRNALWLLAVISKLINPPSMSGRTAKQLSWIYRELRGSQGMGVVSNNCFDRVLLPILHICSPYRRSAVQQMRTSLPWKLSQLIKADQLTRNVWRNGEAAVLETPLPGSRLLLEALKTKIIVIIITMNQKMHTEDTCVKHIVQYIL